MLNKILHVYKNNDIMQNLVYLQIAGHKSYAHNPSQNHFLKRSAHAKHEL